MKINFWNGTYVPKSPSNIMVFGSNPQGYHGKGGALFARNHFGAIYGQGRGLQGNSYGLVTKNLRPRFTEPSTGIYYHSIGERSVSLDFIKLNVNELYECARNNPALNFFITYKLNARANLNGYSTGEIIKCFIRDSEDDIPQNIIFHESTKPLFDIIYDQKVTS